MIKKVVSSCGNEVKNGAFIAPTKLRNFVKSALGGVEDGNIFNIVFASVRAAFEKCVSFYFYEGAKKEAEEAQKSGAWDALEDLKNLINGFRRRIDISNQALHDYTKVKYASRTCRIAQEILKDEFDDPEEMAQRLVNANYHTDTRVDFLLDDESIPDSVGKYNQQISVQPTYNPGTFGA